jgi:hypothetical protein
MLLSCCVISCRLLPGILGRGPRVDIGKHTEETALVQGGDASASAPVQGDVRSGTSAVATGPVAVDTDVHVLSDLARSMRLSDDNISQRVDKIEAAVVRIENQVGTIATHSEATAERIQALSHTINQGPFSGGGPFAFASLVAVLVTGTVLVLFHWRLHRAIARNGLERRMDLEEAELARRSGHFPGVPAS